MKLELKHLAPYLPYRLNIYHSAFMFRSNWNENEIGVMIGVTDNIQNETFDIVMIRERDKYKLQDSRNHFKPILRPLSDLTKEIEHNGEKFVPIECFSENYTDHLVRFEKPDYIILEDDYSLSQNVLGAPLAIIEKLFEWHFDIFQLIENGLAVDINTLKK